MHTPVASLTPFPDLSPTPWRRIMLSESRDVWCLVDAVDYDWLAANTWNISYSGTTRWQFYAKRNTGVKRDTVRMHREILKHADPRGYEFESAHMGDHLNGCTLDNRRANLRWATAKENRINQNGRLFIPSVEKVLATLLAASREAAGLLEEAPF